MKWTKLEHNEVLEGDGFYISFLPNTRNFMGFESKLFAGDDKGQGETALVKDGTYLILNGDYRKEYEEAVPNGYEACRAVYESHQHKASSWSEDQGVDRTLGMIIENVLAADEDAT